MKKRQGRGCGSSFQTFEFLEVSPETVAYKRAAAWFMRKTQPSVRLNTAVDRDTLARAWGRSPRDFSDKQSQKP